MYTEFEQELDKTVAQIKVQMNVMQRSIETLRTELDSIKKRGLKKVGVLCYFVIVIDAI